VQDWPIGEVALKEKFTDGADAMNIVNAATAIAGVGEQMARLVQEVKNASDVIQAARIPARFSASTPGMDSSFEVRICAG